MSFSISYWDNEAQDQRLRQSTPEEDTQYVIDMADDAAKKAAQENEQFNAVILEALEKIDSRSIRPLREGDSVRVADLEQQAAVLRVQLRK